MNITGLEVFIKSIFFLLLLTTVSNSLTQSNIKKNHTFSHESIKVTTTYQTMSTAELQKEVEKQSQIGNLSFALGQELIKRWTKS